MSKPKPQYTPPPDPTKVAGAQTGTNVNSAIASGVIGNVNQSGPYGSTSFNQTDTYKMTGPDGQTYDIPRYTQTTTLSPEQQQLYDQQTRLSTSFNDLAQSQTDRLGSVLGKPVDTTGLSEWGKLSPTDFSADRKRVEDAMYARLNPQLERDRAELETTLVNQGFQRGSEGFNNEMDSSNRAANDARLAITERGLAEQQGLYNMDLSRAGFNNQSRSQGLNETLALRNQPINEVSALSAGGQVSLPQVAQYNAPSIGAANIGDYTYNTAAMNNQKYQSDLQAKTSQQNAIWGALGGLGGAATYGMMGGLFGKK
jgi:hypothetical protein